MAKLRERYKDDKAKLNQEMMELYKREKVNPAAGCLPIVVQIPVFFCLYKMLFVTIEMRHAPFFGWIKDLSAPDPTSWMNLFGLAPWAVPRRAALRRHPQPRRLADPDGRHHVPAAEAEPGSRPIRCRPRSSCSCRSSSPSCWRISRPGW